MNKKRKTRRQVKDKASKRNLILPGYVSTLEYQENQRRNLDLFKRFFAKGRQGELF